MDRREALSEPSAEQDEGFGPGTDLVVSVLALMMVILTLLRINTVIAIGGDLDRSYVARNKEAFVQALETAFGHEAIDDKDHPDIKKIVSGETYISIQDLATIQRISFGTDILFDSNLAVLLPRGKEILIQFSKAIAKQAQTFMEIQISGHADTSGADAKIDNLALAAQRAMAVYHELRGASPLLDPARVLISATSYGEYSPVVRSPRKIFSRSDLNKANATPAQRRENRRIEIAIIYHLSPPGQ